MPRERQQDMSLVSVDSNSGREDASGLPVDVFFLFLRVPQIIDLVQCCLHAKIIENTVWSIWFCMSMGLVCPICLGNLLHWGLAMNLATKNIQQHQYTHSETKTMVCQIYLITKCVQSDFVGSRNDLLRLKHLWTFIEQLCQWTFEDCIGTVSWGPRVRESYFTSLYIMLVTSMSCSYLSIWLFDLIGRNKQLSNVCIALHKCMYSVHKISQCVCVYGVRTCHIDILNILSSSSIVSTIYFSKYPSPWNKLIRKDLCQQKQQGMSYWHPLPSIRHPIEGPSLLV